MSVDIDFDKDGVPSPFVPPPADEAEYLEYMEQLENDYEERVRASYAARDRANLY